MASNDLDNCTVLSASSLSSAELSLLAIKRLLKPKLGRNVTWTTRLLDGALKTSSQNTSDVQGFFCHFGFAVYLTLGLRRGKKRPLFPSLL